jgi:phosphoglycerol transferase MdoB-like AlkP superfamily enzyme
MVLGLAALAFCIPEKWRHFSGNEYANELAGNGLFQFAVAYNQNELSFNKFYQTLPDAEAFSILRKELQAPYASFTSNNLYNIERQIAYPQQEEKSNVVLISIESYSADFMQAFGNTQNLTPHLDSLAKMSLFFTNCYAVGTRTVRGLEALSLSIPPTPGQSTVKRPNNAGLFSLGSVFKSKGYTTQYIYGGDSYFDNMKAFFSGNGYEVIDRSAIKSKDIHYENIWGVADEDLFTMALHKLDGNAALKKPFFTHIMTVSNHRPFTYPDGRIDIPSSSQSREGGVKYTDYAINLFIQEASTKPWFDNTIFVIVADHCASSAGKTELPVTGYHIPLLIYAPKLIPPQVFNGLTSQIDVAPTLLGLLHCRYKSKFFGQDVLNTPVEKQRAFISTYQGLGFLQNGKLIIQEPVKKIAEFLPDFVTGSATATAPTDSLVKKAISYYQCASWLLKNRKYTAE